MDKVEARGILSDHLAKYKERSYSDLARLVAANQVDTAEATGPSGAEYQMEFLFVWDARPNGDIRVIGSIDDGGWRAFIPITDGFIIRPDGTFIGEPAKEA